MHPAALQTPPAAVGILGGMGPAAGADFVRHFVQACGQVLAASGRPVVDQAYPPHWLAQLPVPDRSAALSAADAHDTPLAAMLQAGRQLQALGVRSLALACNTAHAWHAALQDALPGVHVLDGVHAATAQLAAAGVRQVVVLATQGTYASGLYQQALQRAGVACHQPAAPERQQLMAGIYDGVKAGRPDLARRQFQSVALAAAARHGCRTVLMACTEIPLALSADDLPGFTLVDATACMARSLALRAYGLAQWPGALAAGLPCGGFPACSPHAGAA